MRFGLYGFLISAPWRHFAYDVVLAKYLPGTSIRTIAKKVVFSQTVFAVIMFTQFYLFMGMLEGKTFQQS